MKQYIKDGKIYTLPIKIVDENSFKQTYKHEDIIAAGYVEYIHKRTMDNLIAESDLNINKMTDEKILNGFRWNDHEFYLTAENQMNFANMYIAKDYLIYPQTIKTKTGYIELKNAKEVSDFYLAGVNYIKVCLEEGWKEKAEAEAEIRKNYK